MDSRKYLLLSARPFEHSGLTKIEMEIIEYNKDLSFDVASGFELEKEYDDFFKENEVEYIQLSPKKQIFAYMRNIYKVVKNRKYKKVYIHGNSSAMILEALPSKIAGAKVVTHCHNSKPDIVPLYCYIAKPFFNCLVDLKIGCSEMASKWAYFGKRIITIRNGIHIEKYKFDLAMRNKMIDELNVRDRFVVGHIGTFNGQKNHKKLVDIFERIMEKKKEARLLLIGDGELKDEVFEYIRNKGLEEYVITVDYEDNVEDYYQVMDVLIMPSLFEGFCLVALEAQVSGLPVIVSEAIPKEAIVTEKCCRCRLGDDDNEWARKAMEMTAHERKDMSEIVAEKGCSLDVMMETVRSVLLNNNMKGNSEK